MIDYQLVRSTKRKSIALQIKDGLLVVRAPHYVDKSYLDKLVHNKSSWITEKIHQHQEHSRQSEQYNNLTNGGCILLFGKQKSIEVKFSEHNSIVESENALCITFKQRYRRLTNQQLDRKIKQHIEVWFKRQVTLLIDVKLAHYSNATQLFPVSTKIRQYKARWGSCNSRGELSFNYLLMMLPDVVINYVVVHELCHLQHLNHSTEFWQLVEQHYPKTSVAKQWLAEHQRQLVWPKTR